MPEHQWFDAETRELLQRYGFDREWFDAQRKKLQAGTVSRESNQIRGQVEIPQQGDVSPLSAPGSEEHTRLSRIGEAAIRSGEVGMVVLAGGMATRFGGVVKALVEVFDGHTFLDLKLADGVAAAERAGGRVPVYLMTSFATEGPIGDAVRDRNDVRSPARVFAQFVSVRLTPEGEPFVTDGAPSLYAPGHGDFSFALRRSGVLSQFREQGGKHLFMSNVDNLVATLDPAVVGAHIDFGRPITVEVADKAPGDKGGAPARVDDVLQIVESFRFPEAFDQDRIPVFNTNTLLFNAEAIDREFDLTWFAVEKKVDDRVAIQFERLVGELTAFLDSTFLRVEREGTHGRFQPIKNPPDLDERRESIRAILKGRGFPT
ncbi:MAG: UTP--glucose-1-phosphate uridylyltransferase [Myxococcota bacterium]